MMIISAEQVLLRAGPAALSPGSWLKNGPQNLLCFCALPQGKALSSSLKKRKRKKEKTHTLMHPRKNRIKEQASVDSSDVCSSRAPVPGKRPPAAIWVVPRATWACGERGWGQCHMPIPGATLMSSFVILLHPIYDRSYLYHPIRLDT